MPQITLLHTSDKPVFLARIDSSFSQGSNYYRAALPARMTGGSVEHELEISRDGGPFETFSFYRECNILRALHSSSVLFRGLGKPTIVMGKWTGRFPEALELIRLVNAVEPDSIWLEWDDFFSSDLNAAMQTALTRRDLFDSSGAVRHEMMSAAQDTFQAFLKATEEHHRLEFTAARHHVVSTEPLRAVALRYNPAAMVSVGPNAVDPSDFPTRKRTSGRLQVGYASSFLHGMDASLAFEGLVTAARDGAEIVFIGWHPCGPSWGEFNAKAGRYQFRGMEYTYLGLIERFQEYHERIGEFDVAIAPLADCEYNRCKSPQKWFEHSLHATAMVLSDLPVYDCVEHGVTGFRARNAGEFSKYLKLLCSDADLRLRMGQAARDAVLTRYSTAQYAEQWRAAVAL
jgi:hypothetical protein